MKFKYTKPISLLLALLLVLVPLLSSQAQAVAVMTITVSPPNSTQIQHQNHIQKTLKNTPITEHCVLNSSSAKDSHCMSDDGSCPNHMGCCSIIALLSTNIVAFDLTTTRYLISDQQQIVFLPLPAEIKPPR